MGVSDDFSMVPAADPVAPVDDLDAAAQNALTVPAGVQPVAPAVEQPLGRSWDFDWELGQFRRIGQSPAEVVGLGAVAQYAYAVIHTARYAHPVFSDEFGMERPDGVIGEIADAAIIADWQAALVDALLVHDRVTAIENVILDWDPSDGTLTVVRLDIVTDEEQLVTVSDITMQAGGQ